MRDPATGSMRNSTDVVHLVTGFTGAVVPVIVEHIVRKDPRAIFWFALRRDGAGTSARERMDAVIRTLALDDREKERLLERSRAIEIDVEREGLGIASTDLTDISASVGKILHGAADVRFDQPYDEIRVSNVVFTQEMHALHRAIFDWRKRASETPPTLYYLSTAYSYGVDPTPIPEDYPDFRPGPPDNTYVRTKAEAKRCMLEQIALLDDRIVIFEPTIIGGAASDGRTRAYHLHYLLLMLGYLGQLPFLTAPENTLDIVPVDWVADVISDVIVRDELHQGLIRLAMGRYAVSIRQLYDAGITWYRANDPVPGHHIPKIRFVPRWLLPPASSCVRSVYRVLHAATGDPRYRKRAKLIELLEGYLPFIVGRKVFDNDRSTELIRRYTACDRAPTLQDVYDADGSIRSAGYYEKVMADTLSTGWGGRVNFELLTASAGRR